MKHLTTVLFAIAVLLIPLSAKAVSTGPVFNGSVNVPQRGNIVVATPAPVASANVYSAGDSITFGLGINNQSTYGCSHYTYPSPCYVDQMNSFWGTTEQNSGTSHSCLESTTTTGSLCNPSSGYTPLINDWQTSLKPYAGNNTNWFTIMIGTNDVACAISTCDTSTGPDSQISVQTFQSDLDTIVSGLEGQGTPGAQIILGEIPWQNMISPASNSVSTNTRNTLGGEALLLAFNNAIAQIAIKYHTRLAMTYAAMGSCIPAAFPSQTNPCMYDTAHPNNTGHANLATAFEQATILNAYTALAAYQTNGVLNTVVVMTNPYNYLFQTASLQITSNSPQPVLGPLNQYNTIQIGTGATGVNGFIKWLTTSAAVDGVTGDCGAIYTGTSTGIVTFQCSNQNMGLAGTFFPLKGITSNAPILVNNSGAGQECYEMDSASNEVCRDSTSTGDLQLKTAGGTGIDFIIGSTIEAGVKGSSIYWGGSGGPTLSSGSGAPVGACTAGAIYTRTDTSAAAGSEMYVCRNVAGTGTWEAVSGG